MAVYKQISDYLFIYYYFSMSDYLNKNVQKHKVQ